MAQPLGKNGLGRATKRPIDIVAYLTAPRQQSERPAAPPHASRMWRVSRDMYGWAAVALMLGIFVTAQLQTKPTSQPVNTDYPRQVAESTVQRLESEQSALKLEISDLRRQITVQQEEAARNKASFSEINDGLKREQVAAGLTPLTGPGVKVTLNDSTVKTIPAGEKPDNYLIHEYYLRDVVNNLWSNGAEAISINGERIVGTTSIYCVGSTILVNDTRMSPPYVIQAIGEPANLANALKDPAALLDLKDVVQKYGIQLNVEQAPEVKVPAHTGTMHAKFAQPSASKP